MLLVFGSSERNAMVPSGILGFEQLLLFYDVCRLNFSYQLTYNGFSSYWNLKSPFIFARKPNKRIWDQTIAQ